MPKKREGFSFKREYVVSWNYIKESRQFIYSAFLLFLIFGVIGFFFQDLVNVFIKSLFGLDLEASILIFIEQLVERTQYLSYGDLTQFIFLNNIQSSFFSMMLGIIFGIIPLIASITNGYLLGFVAWMSVQANGIFVLWRILPHGIFELPAVFISIGIGLRLGVYVFGKDKRSFKSLIVESIRAFFWIILPLLIIAAVIESGLLVLSN